MNIPIPQLNKWIAALDSGEYKQGQWILDFQWPVSKKWLFELDNDFYVKAGRSFFSLHDWQDYTFPEIATLLELVYIHKILD